jgi:hypothetical protein
MVSKGRGRILFQFCPGSSYPNAGFQLTPRRYSGLIFGLSALLIGHGGSRPEKEFMSGCIRGFSMVGAAWHEENGNVLDGGVIVERSRDGVYSLISRLLMAFLTCT